MRATELQRRSRTNRTEAKGRSQALDHNLTNWINPFEIEEKYEYEEEGDASRVDFPDARQLIKTPCPSGGLILLAKNLRGETDHQYINELDPGDAISSLEMIRSVVGGDAKGPDFMCIEIGFFALRNQSYLMSFRRPLFLLLSPRLSPAGSVIGIRIWLYNAKAVERDVGDLPVFFGGWPGLNKCDILS